MCTDDGWCSTRYSTSTFDRATGVPPDTCAHPSAQVSSRLETTPFVATNRKWARELSSHTKGCTNETATFELPDSEQSIELRNDKSERPQGRGAADAHNPAAMQTFYQMEALVQTR